MSLTFYGAFSALFYTIVLGAIWPTRGDMELSAALLDLIAKSLWMSWLVVVASFFLGLPNAIKPLCLVVAAAICVQIFLGPRVAMESHAVPFGVLVALGLSTFLFFGGFGSDYRLVFVTGDAVVSWNRWAVELSDNLYNPSRAAYPMLFPGVWSLIYKAQQSASVWIFAKLTLFLLVLILTLLVCWLYNCGLIVCAAALTAFAASFFVYKHAFPLVNGDMDMPLSVMCLAACVSMLIALDHLERHAPEAQNSVILAVLFTSLAAITKQPGVALLLPLFVLLGFCAWTKAISYKGTALCVCLALLPLVTFLAMYLTRRTDPLGNLESLRHLSQTIAKERTTVEMAAEHLMNAVPAWALIAVLGCALLNLVNVRRMSNQIGLLLLVLSIFGFFQYAKCCSYDGRNVWWVVTFLFGSALFGLKTLDTFRVSQRATRYWPAASLRGTVLAASVLLGLAVRDRISESTISEAQVRAQLGVLGRILGPMFNASFLPIQTRNDLLISELGIVKWTPGLISSFLVCESTEYECFAQAAMNYPEARIFVLIERGVLEYPVIAHLLTGDRLIARAQAFELHGPFLATELSDVGRRQSDYRGDGRK